MQKRGFDLASHLDKYVGTPATETIMRKILVKFATIYLDCSPGRRHNLGNLRWTIRRFSSQVLDYETFCTIVDLPNFGQLVLNSSEA